MKKAEQMEIAIPEGEGSRQMAPIAAPGDMMALLRMAIDKGVPVETMEKLVTLHERVADRNAAQEFADALRAFQEQCPAIKRAAKTDYTTKSGTRVHYDYAPLKEIAKTVKPILARHGLSFTWDMVLADGVLTCRCIVRHQNGHREESSFAVPVEQTDRMSASQRTNSAATVARRQSLISALGLTDTDDDDDGAAPSGKITEEQAANLEAFIDEVKADRGRFLRHFKVERLADLTDTAYAEAVRLLQEKRRSA